MDTKTYVKEAYHAIRELNSLVSALPDKQAKTVLRVTLPFYSAKIGPFLHLVSENLQAQGLELKRGPGRPPAYVKALTTSPAVTKKKATISKAVVKKHGREKIESTQNP